MTEEEIMRLAAAVQAVVRGIVPPDVDALIILAKDGHVTQSSNMDSPRVIALALSVAEHEQRDSAS